MAAGNKKPYMLLSLQVCLPPGIKELKVQLRSFKKLLQYNRFDMKTELSKFAVVFMKNILQFSRRSIYDFCL